MTGYFFIIRKESVIKRHRGKAAHHHQGYGTYSYKLYLVDEDWQPLPSPIQIHPNDCVAINEAAGEGENVSEDNPVIVTLKPNGTYAVAIDQVVTDHNTLTTLRERAIKRRPRRSVGTRHAASA